MSKERISFAAEVSSWEESNKDVTVLLSNGEKIRTKILIGADGLNSKIRERLFPKATKRYSGSSSYRAIVLTPPQMKSNLHISREIWAPGCRLGFSPLLEKKIYWYLTFDSLPSEQKNPAKNKSDALSFTDRFFKEYRDLIKAAEDSEIIHTDIYDLKPIVAWSKGRIGLIGDAAHATTPNLGQWGAQAVEDAYALIAEVEKHGLGAQALSSFFSRRKKKVRGIVRDQCLLEETNRIAHKVKILRNRAVSEGLNLWECMKG